MTVDLDWENLGFNYRKLPFRYISYYKDGKWDEGQLTERDLVCGTEFRRQY